MGGGGDGKREIGGDGRRVRWDEGEMGGGGEGRRGRWDEVRSTENDNE